MSTKKKTVIPIKPSKAQAVINKLIAKHLQGKKTRILLLKANGFGGYGR